MSSTELSIVDKLRGAVCWETSMVPFVLSSVDICFSFVLRSFVLRSFASRSGAASGEAPTENAKFFLFICNIVHSVSVVFIL